MGSYELPDALPTEDISEWVPVLLAIVDCLNPVEICFPEAAPDDAAAAVADLSYWIMSALADDIRLSALTTLPSQLVSLELRSADDVLVDFGDGFTQVVPANQITSVQRSYPTIGDKLIRFAPYANITRFVLTTDNFNFSLGAIAGMTALTRLNCSNSDVSGEVDALSSMTALTDLRLDGTLVTGSINALAQAQDLTLCWLFDTSLSGNISAFSRASAMLTLQLQDTFVSGDIGTLMSLTLMHTFRADNTSISGNVGTLSSAALRTLRVPSTSVSGSISAALTGLEYLDISDAAARAPSLGSCPALEFANLQNCQLSASEVDAMIDNIWQARAGFAYATPTLIINGGNAAPSGIYQAASPPASAKEKIYDLVNNFGWSIVGNGF